MNRLQYAARLMGILRLEKQPPLARYAFTLAAAAGGPAGASCREIAAAVGEPYAVMGGSLTKIEDAGLIRRVPGASPIRYTPTEAGLRLIAPLINPEPVPA